MKNFYAYEVTFDNMSKKIQSDRIFLSKSVAMENAMQYILTLGEKISEVTIQVKNVNISVEKKKKVTEKLYLENIKDNETFDTHKKIYIYKKTFPIKSVLMQVGKKQAVFNNQKVKMTSDRYLNFKYNGTVCKKCGLEGKFFELDRYYSDLEYHFNLYGIDENGNKVMLTKDHIIPRSAGGKDDVSNYQCLCERCNCKKGSMNNDDFMK